VLLGLLVAAVDFLQEISVVVLLAMHILIHRSTRFVHCRIMVDQFVEDWGTYWMKSASSLEEALIGGPAAVLGLEPPLMAR
jgi:hypothetical protein